MSDEQVELEIRDPDERVSRGRLILRAVIVVGVLAIGGLVLATLLATGPDARKKDEHKVAPIVEVVPVTVGAQQVDVTAPGTVIPARQVQLAAEVGGRVTWIDPDLEPGGRFGKGERLLKVDARDYQLAVEQQAAQVTQARTALELEKARRRVAEKEWAAFGETPAEGSVAIRDPQIKAAEGAVAAAESGLQRTRLAVSKTGLAAPFNAMVLTRQVELGQLVGPGAPLAILVGTDHFWVEVAIPVEKLPWIRVPGVAGVAAGEGSPATVEEAVGDDRVVRRGRVVRLAGDVDPVGRMARVIVEIDDPLGLRDAAPGLPLLVNAYVDVTIEGKPAADVAEIPRLALHEDDKVWLVEGDVLRIRDVEVVWRRRDTVLVRGVGNGAQVVTSPVPGAVDGMAIRVAPPPAPTEAKGKGTP